LTINEESPFPGLSRISGQSSLQVIFGAGGTTANALARELLNNHHTIRLVSRRPVNTTGKNSSWTKADLMIYDEVVNAAKGASVIYLCNGVGYKNQDWKDHWPVIMQNAIDAAKKTGARLLFFDNTYMYGRVTGPMTESTPYNPCSVKGEVRARSLLRLMSLFNQAAASQLEMFYNWEQDYDFVSSKFEQYFNVEPSSYAEGIRQLSEGLYKRRF
jgi:hypothetical protein